MLFLIKITRQAKHYQMALWSSSLIPRAVGKIYIDFIKENTIISTYKRFF